MTLPGRPPKRKLRGRHQQDSFTPAFVRNVSRAGRYCDGTGFYLDVRPTVSRGWIQRLTIRGCRTELGLGGYSLVSLKEAREDVDALSEKRRAESKLILAEVAGVLRDQLGLGRRSPYHVRLRLVSMERRVFPRISEMQACEVTSADVIGVLASIWHQKATTTRQLGQHIRTVIAWAMAMDLRLNNPCDWIGPSLGAQN